MSDILEQVREFVIETFLFGEDEQTFENSDSFLEEGIIDSTGILEVVGWLEETFDFTVSDTELIPENFDSANNLAAYIKTKTQAE